MFDKAFCAIEEAITPPLSRVLKLVREVKEEAMSEGTFKCAICDKGGFKAARYVKTHMKLKHKDVLEEEYAGVPPEPIEEGVEEAPPAAATEPTPTSEVAPEPPSSEKEHHGAIPPSTSEEVAPGVTMEEIPAPGPPVVPSEEQAVVVPIPPQITPPPAPLPRVLSVPVGSALFLNGAAWRQNETTMSWESANAENLTIQVLQKEVVQGDVMLICRAQEGSALWALPEKLVLEGAIQIVKLAPIEPSMGALGFKPEDGERAVEEPEYDYFEEQRAVEEAAAAHQEYVGNLRRYVEVRDAKSAAAKAFEEIRKELREPLMEYVRQHGSPSEPGSASIYLESDGFAAQIAVTVGQTHVIRDEEAIVEWLQENGYDDCLRMVLDVQKWEALKAEQGDDKKPIVPPEFIRKVERPHTDPNQEKLRVDKVAG